MARLRPHPTVAKADFNSGETALLSEIARELAADPDRWTVRPPDHPPSWSDTASALTQSLLAAIVAEDAETALEICETRARDLAKTRVADSIAAGENLGYLMAALAVARSAFEAEIIRRTAADRERQLGALLGFTRLWTQMLERFAAAYTSAAEAQPRAKRIESARRRSSLATRLAHEIRTPLNVILGYADIMAERLQELDDPMGARHGAAIKRAGDRLLRMISAVLELSKASAEAYELKPERIDLGAFVRRELAEMEVLARRKKIELNCIIEEPAAVVRFDARCLSGALVNLVQNAIKFTAEGVVTVRVYREDAGALCLEVRDTGAGIDAAYLPRLFEPFTREDSALTRGVEGSGLGLALTRRYLELNGARITARSEKNAGSSFTIVFAGAQLRARSHDSGAT
jgi:signal transduction histidine kinase